MDFYEIVKNVSAIDTRQIFLILKIIFLSLSLYFIGFIVFALAKTTWLKRLIFWDLAEFMTYKHFALSGTTKEWNKIKEKLETGTSAEAKVAIIEADNLLNDLLKQMGYKGETMGEKLDLLNSTIIPNLDQLKQAHKIKSNIIHDPSYHLDVEGARRIISAYEQALESLQAIF